MKVYVATSWRNERHAEVVQRLRDAGHNVFDFRNPTPDTTGFSFQKIDRFYTSWSPEEFRSILASHSSVQSAFRIDMEALRNCDAVVYLQPCGCSASLELGWAAAAGKLTIVLLAAQQPDLMLRMADFVCTSVDEVLSVLEMEHRACWWEDTEAGVPERRDALKDDAIYFQDTTYLERFVGSTLLAAQDRRPPTELQALAQGVAVAACWCVAEKIRIAIRKLNPGGMACDDLGSNHLKILLLMCMDRICRLGYALALL